MEALGPHAPVKQLVQGACVTVEGDDDMGLGAEQLVELVLREAVGMKDRGEEAHQIDDVHHSHPQLGCPRTQDRRGGERLERGHVADAREHHVGIAGALARRPVPDRRAPGRVLACRLHVEVLQVLLLVDDYEVGVVAALQAVVGDREQGVGVGRQVDARHPALEGDHRVDQPGPLVAEAVVVVAPAGGGEQQVERRHGLAPGHVSGRLEPLGVLDQSSTPPPSRTPRRWRTCRDGR